jgi:hypothetical protein
VAAAGGGAQIAGVLTGTGLRVYPVDRATQTR